MMGTTERQRACLAAIRAYRKREGRMPTLDELGAALGLSSRAAVSRLLLRLEQRGYLKRIPGARRAIALRKTKCPRCGSDVVVPK